MKRKIHSDIHMLDNAFCLIYWVVLDQTWNLLNLLNPCSLSSVSVVKEEKPYAEEDVDDGGDEGEVQEQASKVLDAHTSLADQVDKEEAQLEGKGEEHDEQVGKGKELILTFQEA